MPEHILMGGRAEVVDCETSFDKCCKAEEKEGKGIIHILMMWVEATGVKCEHSRVKRTLSPCSHGCKTKNRGGNFTPSNVAFWFGKVGVQAALQFDVLLKLGKKASSDRCCRFNIKGQTYGPYVTAVNCVTLILLQSTLVTKIYQMFSSNNSSSYMFEPFSKLLRNEKRPPTFSMHMESPTKC